MVFISYDSELFRATEQNLKLFENALNNDVADVVYMVSFLEIIILFL